MREKRALHALVLFGLALALRLVAGLALAGEPVWDGHYYDFGAKRIAAGQGYSDDVVVSGISTWHPWCHYPVGYSGFLALFYRLFGAGPHVAPVVGAFVGAALAVVTYGLALQAFAEADERRGRRRGEGRAFLAGLLVAIHPGLVLYAALVMTEPLAALLTLSSFWLYGTAHGDGRSLRWGRLVGAGLVLGLAALVRPQALLTAPFFVLHAWWRARRRPPTDGATAAGPARWRGLAVVATVFATATLLPVLPWTARNCRVMDGCALVSTNAGWNLAIGAFPRATGRFETLRATDGCRVVTGQVQQDRCWLEYGLHAIRQAPGRWLALMPKKLAFTFDHESFAVEYLREARPALWPEARRVAVREAVTLAHRLLLVVAALSVPFALRGSRGLGALAVYGAVAAVTYDATLGASGRFWPLALIACVAPLLAGRRSIPAAPLVLGAALLGTTALTHAVFFGEDRYHVVVTPVLCLLAAGAFRRSEADKSKSPTPR